jgi:hypothetical protein
LEVQLGWIFDPVGEQPGDYLGMSEPDGCVKGIVLAWRIASLIDILDDVYVSERATW